MSRFYIAEIDKKVNKGKLIQLDKAMKNVTKYIIKYIDDSFCSKSFEEWLEGEGELPFKWGKNTYYWEIKSKH